MRTIGSLPSASAAHSETESDKHCRHCRVLPQIEDAVETEALASSGVMSRKPIGSIESTSTSPFEPVASAHANLQPLPDADCAGNLALAHALAKTAGELHA